VLPLLLALALLQAPAADAPKQDPAPAAPKPEALSDAAKKARADLDAVKKNIEKMMTFGERDQKLREQLQAGSDDEERLKKLSKMREELGREYQDLRKATIKAMEEVIASASEALKTAPDDAGVLEVRSEAYLIYQKNDLALPDLERLLKLKPDDGGELTLKVARVEHAVNRYEAAAANFEKVVRKDAKNLEARMMLAICYFSIQRFDESVKLLQELLKGEVTADIRGKAAQFLEMAQKYVPFWKTEQEIRMREAKADDLPRVRLSTTKGDIDIELFENDAPNTVANFIELVRAKFYDGLKFHRVIPGFMAQGGDPTGSGAGGPGYRFKDEIKPESRLHFRGTLSMANAGPDTNGSQFFLTHLPTEWLNGKHTVFGRVIAGQDVVDSLSIGDAITKAEVVRKREHEYKVAKIDETKPSDK
jgi:peptidyl-prolyl cis-trans isomerase B (cyclophilin B)